MEDATALRRSVRPRRLPARYVVNHVSTSDDGGLNLLNHILNTDDELEIECDETDFPSLAQSFIKSEVTYANAALTEPIEDSEEKDPATVQEAQSSIYWTYWLAAIYEEL